MPYGITQRYLWPNRGDIPALTPAMLVLNLATPEGCDARLSRPSKTNVTDTSSDPERSSVDVQARRSPLPGCFLLPSASEWSSRTRSRTGGRVFETECETADAGTCSRLPPQNAGHGSSWDTSQTPLENPSTLTRRLATSYLSNSRITALRRPLKLAFIIKHGCDNNFGGNSTKM